jgi:hypothetical protein
MPIEKLNDTNRGSYGRRNRYRLTTDPVVSLIDAAEPGFKATK